MTPRVTPVLHTGPRGRGAHNGQLAAQLGLADLRSKLTPLRAAEGDIYVYICLYIYINSVCGGYCGLRRCTRAF